MCSLDFILPRSTRAPVSDSRFANELWNGIMAGSGSSHDPARDRRSASPSRSEDETPRTRQILIAEDSPADVFLIREALAGVDAEIHIFADGEKIIEFLAQVERDPQMPCPDLLLLDINLPKHKGGEILKAIRSGARCGKTKVLVVTSSDSITDRARMDRLGAKWVLLQALRLPRIHETRHDRSTPPRRCRNDSIVIRS